MDKCKQLQRAVLRAAPKIQDEIFAEWYARKGFEEFLRDCPDYIKEDIRTSQIRIIEDVLWEAMNSVKQEQQP
jgi:hypothetical protein